MKVIEELTYYGRGESCSLLKCRWKEEGSGIINPDTKMKKNLSRTNPKWIIRTAFMENKTQVICELTSDIPMILLTSKITALHLA